MQIKAFVIGKYQTTKVGGDFLGKGAFGSVFRVRLSSDPGGTCFFCIFISPYICWCNVRENVNRILFILFCSTRGAHFALKELQSNGDDAIQKAREEARLLRPLKHKNIVMLVDEFTEEGKHYIVLE